MANHSPFYVEHKAPIERLDSELWHFVVRIPNEIASRFIEGNDRRVVCSIGESERFHCALMPEGGGIGSFIMINQKRREKLGLVLGQEVTLRIEKDRSEYGMPMSDEFREVLAQDDEAHRIFHALTPGKQRTLIYWADNVKSSDIKIRRAIVFCNHLLRTQGKIDFKQLNQEMKEANQRRL